MKNALTYLLFILVSLSGCKKEVKPLFSQSPDERLNETLTKYQTQLVGAENGWKAFIYPKAGGTYFFYFKFNAQNRVNMYSTFDLTSAVTLKESSYRLKALQQPSLIFDTYSYVHILADPNENVLVRANVNGGPIGVGLQSDFEFYFDSSTTDTIKLVGRFNGSKAVLVKATQQEANGYNNRSLATGFLFQNIQNYLNYFKRATIGGTTYEISVNQGIRTITFNWLDPNGNFQTFTTAYYFSETGINFISPLVNGSQTITGFNNIQWNAATTTLSFSANGQATTVVGSGQPIKVDVGAAKRWWDFSISQDDAWVSLNGFHVDGVDDAYNVRSLAGYNFMFYYSQYGSGYDWAGIIAATNYGPALDATFTPDGKVSFKTPGNFGSVPSAASATVTKIRNQYLQPSGYYFVQTSQFSYDMVSALDGKAWISWIY